jgi:hypothetical protein
LWSFGSRNDFNHSTVGHVIPFPFVLSSATERLKLKKIYISQMIGDGFEDYVYTVTFSSVFICVFTLKQMQTLLIYDQWRSQPDSLVMLCKYFRVHRP